MTNVNPRKKQMTREEAEIYHQKAIRGLENLGLDDEAEDIAAQDSSEYAESKGITVLDRNSNRKLSNRQRKETTMTKPELEEILDEVQDILEDVYTPEANREELAEAVGRALDLLEGEEQAEEEEEEEAEEIEPELD